VRDFFELDGDLRDLLGQSLPDVMKKGTPCNGQLSTSTFIVAKVGVSDSGFTPGSSDRPGQSFPSSLPLPYCAQNK